jgi:hypothetical protein
MLTSAGRLVRLTGIVCVLLGLGVAFWSPVSPIETEERATFAHLVADVDNAEPSATIEVETEESAPPARFWVHHPLIVIVGRRQQFVHGSDSPPPLALPPKFSRS